MPNRIEVEPLELRDLAKALRESAEKAAWPGYAKKLIEAAKQLEQRAVEIEGTGNTHRKDQRSR